MKRITGRKGYDKLTEKSKIIPIESINKSVATKINSERTGERVLDLAQLQNLKSLGAVDCNFSSLKDLNEVMIDNKKSTATRMISYAEQIQNPYLFKVGEFEVKVEYGDGVSFSEALVNILNAG